VAANVNYNLRHNIHVPFNRYLQSLLKITPKCLCIFTGDSEILLKSNSKSFSKCLVQLKAGMPQGSVLSPLLFLIFINDVADNMTGFGRLFADDTCIGHVAHNEENLHTLISTDLFQNRSNEN
jgi:hypothetical protein